MKRDFFDRRRDVIFLMVIFAALMYLVFNIRIFHRGIVTAVDISKPIMTGCLMAFILNIITSAWEKIYFRNSKNKFVIKSRRGICILLSILSITVLIYLLLRIVIPQINNFLTVFVNNFPDIYEKIKHDLLAFAKHLPNFKGSIFSQKNISETLNAQEIMNRVGTLISSWSGGLINFLNSVFGMLANLVMGFIIAIYIVGSKETLMRQFDKLFRKTIQYNHRIKLYHFLEVTNKTFRAFFIGQFIEAIILGTLCSIGLFLFGFPYPAMIGSVVGSTALIPLVGAYIGGAFGFLMIFSVSPFKAFMFIVFLIILQQIEGNAIYPKVVGSSVGLPGLWVMVAILIGAGVAGIIGVLFSVPVAATIYKLTKDYVNS